MTDYDLIARAKGRLNCPCCGAPIQGDTCQYCGALLVDVGCVKTDRPTYLKFIDAEGRVNIVLCLLEKASFESGEMHTLYADGAPMLMCKASSRLVLEFQVL